MDDLIKGDLVTNEKMAEGELVETPEFYSSLTDRPNVNRLRSLDIKVNVPYISEYIEFVAPSASSYTVNFKEKYRSTPLVLGLQETTAYTGERVTIPIYTDGLFLRVDTEGLTVGTFFGLTEGDRFRLRVYNLDYFAVPTNIRPSYVGSNFSFNLEDEIMLGELRSIAFNSVPTGYLECNGQAVSRTTYVDLFNLLGTTYGVGDGSTTFNLPNPPPLNADSRSLNLFRAIKNGTQSIANSTTTQVTGWTVQNDTGSGWDATNNKYVFNRAGFYKVSVQLEYVGLGAGELLQVIILPNTGDQVRSQTTYTGWNGTPVAMLFKSFSLNDSFQINVYNVTGANRVIQNTVHTYITVEEVLTNLEPINPVGIWVIKATN